jgi:TRAP-type C4-dicarboxylate transport system permease small subunit
MDIWEKLFIGIVAMGALYIFLPGTRQMIEKSKDAPKDWMGLLIPIGAVILFIVFLISSV